MAVSIKNNKFWKTITFRFSKNVKQFNSIDENLSNSLEDNLSQIPDIQELNKLKLERQVKMAKIILQSHFRMV